MSFWPSAMFETGSALWRRKPPPQGRSRVHRRGGVSCSGLVMTLHALYIEEGHVARSDPSAARLPAQCLTLPLHRTWGQALPGDPSSVICKVPGALLSKGPAEGLQGPGSLSGRPRLQGWQQPGGSPHHAGPVPG